MPNPENKGSSLATELEKASNLRNVVRINITGRDKTGHGTRLEWTGQRFGGEETFSGLLKITNGTIHTSVFEEGKLTLIGNGERLFPVSKKTKGEN